MNDLRNFWNKNTARIPDGKSQSLYATDKERRFAIASDVCDQGGGTVARALEYLDFLSSKGHVAPGAVRALRK